MSEKEIKFVKEITFLGEYAQKKAMQAVRFQKIFVILIDKLKR